MTAELVLAPEVEQDVSEACSWYNERRIGLGAEFLTCVDACIQSICRNPEMHTIVYRNFRRGLVRRFPYTIFYEYVNNTVIIYAVFHTSQNPLKWRRRIP
ncbi:MAG: type II toxin-antitoxin system RelE/ParE family toxin [Acidobacteria bacterium]|nr:type II toxin-antitoxin system RelE/ParE family toxin [Acidobacteriota bacterium]